ncbi:hypothetical protein BH18THE1_BH18THE1_00980 [soil metagenome]
MVINPVARFSSIFILIFSIYSIGHLPLGNAQIENWKRYNDPEQKFTFLYPPNWVINSTYNDANGIMEVILMNPNSNRMKVLIAYIPNDPLLFSDTAKPVVPSRALTNLEEDTSVDYVFFNSTGKFPHKYTVQGYESASDIIDYEKIKGRPGKMLIVLAKITDKDTLVFSYTESKRTFYKTLSNASQIIKSISILNH